MDRQLPVGPLLAGLGALIVSISLFLDWWDGLNAFTAFEVLDLVLLGLACVMIASVAGVMGLARSTISPGLTVAIAIATVVIVVTQIVNDPPIVTGGARDHSAGIWLALIGGVLMTGGALLSYASISLAIDVKPRGGRAHGDDDSPAPGPEAPAPDGPAPRSPASRSSAPASPAPRSPAPGRPSVDASPDVTRPARPGSPRSDDPTQRLPGRPAPPDPDAPTERP